MKICSYGSIGVTRIICDDFITLINCNILHISMLKSVKQKSQRHCSTCQQHTRHKNRYVKSSNWNALRNINSIHSLTVVEINTMMKHVKDVSNFINISQTRNIAFEENVRNYFQRESQKKRLVDVCRTRWVVRVERILLVWIHSLSYLSVINLALQLRFNTDSLKGWVD